MESYKISIETAIIFFPIIALLLTLPYMIKQYHKYGSIPALRTAIVYSFVLYLLTAYFMCILPLPDVDEVAQYTKPWVNLVPFGFITDIKNSFTPNIIAFFKSPAVYTNLFNIALTIPFGIYLRYYFKKNWFQTILYTFLLSLFFEVTQITGLYGIYPRPYRLFDVDDLIINTTGGFIGYLITPLFSFILPTREKLDEKALKNGEKVSNIRRLLACFLDLLIFDFITIIINSIFGYVLEYGFTSFNYLIYMLLNITIFRGKTLGKMIVKLKISDINGNKPKYLYILLRYSLRYIIYVRIYSIVEWIIDLTNIKGSVVDLIKFTTLIIMALIYLKTIIDLFKNKQLIYEKISKTKNESMISSKKKTNDLK